MVTATVSAYERKLSEYPRNGADQQLSVTLDVNMLVAIAMVHRHLGVFVNWYGTQKGDGFEYHLLPIALAVLILVKGSRAFAIDSLLANTLTRLAV